MTENKTLIAFKTILAEAETNHKILLEKLSSDVRYQFKWVGETLFKENIKIGILKPIVQKIEELIAADKADLVIIERYYEYFTKQVMSTDLMDRSSSQLASLTSLWEKEVYVKLIEDLKWKLMLLGS